MQQYAADDHKYNKEYEGLFELCWDVQSEDVGNRFKEERAPFVLSGPRRAYGDNSVEDKSKYLHTLVHSLEAVIVRDGAGALFPVNCGTISQKEHATYSKTEYPVHYRVENIVPIVVELRKWRVV